MTKAGYHLCAMPTTDFSNFTLAALLLWPWKHAWAQDKKAIAYFWRDLFRAEQRPGEGTIEDLVTDDDGS